MSSVEDDVRYKLLLLGPAGAGKSSILTRFSDDVFSQAYMSTIGIDFKHKLFHHHGKTFRLQIWDTAGQERFRTITSSYHRGAHAFFLVFDLTAPDQFLQLNRFVDDINRFAVGKPKVIIVGTKSDLVLPAAPAILPADIATYCQKGYFPYIEVSAKTGHNISAMFGMIMDLLLGPESQYHGPLIPLPAPLKITVREHLGTVQEWIDKLLFNISASSSVTPSSLPVHSTNTSTSSSAPVEHVPTVTIEDETMSGRLLDRRDFDLRIHSCQIDLPVVFASKLINKATAAIRQGFRQFVGKGVPTSFEDLKLAKDDYPAIGLTCCVHDPQDDSICELLTNNEIGLLSKNFIVFECLLKPSYLESTYFWRHSLLVGPAGLTTVLWDIVNSYLPASQTEDLYVRFYSYEDESSVAKSTQYAVCELRNLKTKLTSSKTCVRFTQEEQGQGDRFEVLVSHSTFLVRRGKSVEVQFSQYPAVCTVMLSSLRLVMCIEQGKLSNITPSYTIIS